MEYLFNFLIYLEQCPAYKSGFAFLIWTLSLSLSPLISNLYLTQTFLRSVGCLARDSRFGQIRSDIPRIILDVLVGVGRRARRVVALWGRPSTVPTFYSRRRVRRVRLRTFRLSFILFFHYRGEILSFSSDTVTPHVLHDENLTFPLCHVLLALNYCLFH